MLPSFCQCGRLTRQFISWGRQEKTFRTGLGSFTSQALSCCLILAENIWLLNTVDGFDPSRNLHSVQRTMCILLVAYYTSNGPCYTTRFLRMRLLILSYST